MTCRKDDFEAIKAALLPSVRFSSETAVAAEGDSLELLKRLPDHSVTLILTDPPYHATKKDNIYGDTHFEEDRHYLDWMAEYATQWRRVLKQNGSLFCFCDSSMAARLEVTFSSQFNVLSHVVWTKPNEPGFDGWKGKMKKEALRQWYSHSERIIFAEPAMEGNLHRSPFAELLRAARTGAGLSQHELTGIIGAYGKVNHGGAVSNWETGRNSPSKEQYDKMRAAILATGKVKAMPDYENAVRVFKMDGSKQFTDVWTFPSVRPYRGKHPAEKPADMLEHAIEATTNAGDIVLDCFGGSGSTAIAAVKLGRRAVSVEIDPTWSTRIAERLAAILDEDAAAPDAVQRPDAAKKPKLRRETPQMGLFVAETGK
jgi:site-specific DNA-methyltransferase (adenine-specific)